jgi:hypothetical protein
MNFHIGAPFLQGNERMSEPPASTSPKRRRGLPLWVVVMTLAAVVLGAAWLVYAANRPEGGVWVDELRADAETRLPKGSSREQAKEWFASRGISDVQEARDITSSGYRAIVPNSTWMESGEIIVTCMFDRKDQLERISIIRRQVGR